MAVRALQIWATVVEGDSPIGTRVFSLGGAPESLTLGTAGTWTIQAAGVTQIHAKLHFDGEHLAIAPIAEITIHGATIPRSGTILEAPVEIVMGSARIVFLQRAKVTHAVRSLKGGERKRARDGDDEEADSAVDALMCESKALEVTTSPRAVVRVTPSKAFAVGARTRGGKRIKRGAHDGREPDGSATGAAISIGRAALALARPAVATTLRNLDALRRRAGARAEIAAASTLGALIILGATLYALHVPSGSDARGVAERAKARASVLAPSKAPGESAVPLTRVALATPAFVHGDAEAADASPPAARSTRRVAARAGADLGIPLERRVVDAIARGDDHEAARLLEEAASAGPASPTYSELLRILRERAAARR